MYQPMIYHNSTCSPIAWQWRKILDQNNICLKSTTPYRFLQTNTMSINIPTSENTLLLFVAHLAMQKLSRTSIKVYLSAVRNLHITSGNHHHFTTQLTPCLQMVLNDIKREQATTKSIKVRCSITAEIILQINIILSQQPCCYNNIMMWAACCLAFLTSCV